MKKLNSILLEEMPQHKKFASKFADELLSQSQLFRSLRNVRPSMPLSEVYIELQDIVISYEREEKGLVDVSSLPTASDPNILLWRGDITPLNADAIVNAANSDLLGCFHPCHGCIDNAIHSAAGSQLRDACSKIMDNQGYEEPTGQAKITAAYNLPSKHVIHTVGPIIKGPLQERDRELLASCYFSCLELAERNKIHSIAFCCISTGEYRFPANEAGEMAVNTVKKYLKNCNDEMKVIFNVFKESDEVIYRNILGADRKASRDN